MQWIENYLIYNEQHEAKEIYHKWCAISVLASILTGRIWTRLGYSKLNPNFYICLVGGPAIPRKTEAIKVTQPIMEAMVNAGLIESAPESLTLRALTSDLSLAKRTTKCKDGTLVDYSTFLATCTEIRSFIRANDKEFATFLLKMFDGENYRHKTKSCGEDIIINGTLNILAATTPEFFSGTEFTYHVASGLCSRFIFLYLDSKRFNLPYPDLDNPKYEQIHIQLIRDLQHLANIAGEIKASPEGKQTFIDFYSKQSLKVDCTLSPQMQSYVGRRQTYITKLAMIFASLDYLKGVENPVITKIHMETAIQWMAEAETYMNSAYEQSGKSIDAEATLAVINCIANRKDMEIPWIGHAEIFSTLTKDITKEVLTSIIDNLVNQQKVVQVKNIGGRLWYKWIGIKKEDWVFPKEGEE